MNMKIENWQGHKIRFVEEHGEWWAVLGDICNALQLRTNDVAKRLDTDMMIRMAVGKSNTDSTGVRSRGNNKTRWMIGVNELGIYEALFASRRLEARQLRRWTATVLQRLRRHVGLEGYEVMRMTETEVQEDIDHFLDTIFYDETTGKVMRSVTVAGGDVDQIELDNEDQELFKNAFTIKD